MPWIEKSAADLAKDLGINIREVKAKQRIMEIIVKTRKEKGLTQKELAKRVGVSQARIAQIESGIGTAKVTFDVLLNILSVMGVEYSISFKRRAA